MFVKFEDISETQHQGKLKIGISINVFIFMLYIMNQASGASCSKLC